MKRSSLHLILTATILTGVPLFADEYDLVITNGRVMDPETMLDGKFNVGINVKDNATYKSGEQGLPTTGIPYVIVSGVPVVSESKFQLDVRPGKSIRFPVEPKGRFKPLTVEDWSRKHTIRGFTIDAGALGQPNSGAIPE